MLVTLRSPFEARVLGRRQIQFTTWFGEWIPYHDADDTRDTSEDALPLLHERPKYGALNVLSHPDGASPRFGSCYFELSQAVLARSTFTWGDSHTHPQHVGALDHVHFDAVLAAWLEAIEHARDAPERALGIDNARCALSMPSAALPQSITSAAVARTHWAAAEIRPPARVLDDYIEAQVHGVIDLARDVTALVIDPSFDGTETGEHLAAIAARYRLAFGVRRHGGFAMYPAEVPLDFRGPWMRALAERIAGDAPVDAARIGCAAQSLERDPTQWRDWDSPAETWQHIKQLWHVLVRFGRPRASF